ncbi:hypothetical protein HRI_001953000 [Hibiscus trionum]|uniref:Endonuclease/exonuclease/phosphatase domain-containing protein n=1 Tax=Hibiscus trionum TaxID=183268 RepID=A0A9W7HSU2_HIBTR|nr:hypothetical protein HRI_001953000 [Hibiscus trionum]
MNCLLFTWNVRGLGRPEKIRAVTSVLKSCAPKIVFLQETKLSHLSLSAVRRLKNAGFSEVVVSPSIGSSGGLIVMWNGNWLKVRKTIIKNRWVCLIGQIENMNGMCGFINLYTPNDLAGRKIVFEELSTVVVSLNLPVILGGDFNCVKSDDERLGLDSNIASMTAFSDFIQRNNFVDLPLVGERFTWFMGGHSLAASRLDRVLFSPEVLVWFPNLVQASLARNLSDHKPVILREQSGSSKARPFKLFSHWLDIPEVVQVTKIAIEDKDRSGVFEALVVGKKAIKNWVSLFRQRESSTVMEAERKADAIEKHLCLYGFDQEKAVELTKLRQVIWDKYRRDEREWHQKSRVRWFNEGDKNSKFFHLSASMRRCRNIIVSLEHRGRTFSDQKEISREFVEFFRRQYNSSNTMPIKRFDCALKQLSDGSAKDLESHFSEKEIWDIICSMDGNRAPGSDGLNMEFYKKKIALLEKSCDEVFLRLLPW